MSQGRPDRDAAEIARTQHGLLRVDDATRAGLTERMIRTRVANGLLRTGRSEGAPRRGRSGHVAAGTPRGGLLRRVGAVASHRAAALLHELDTFGRRTRPFVEISVPRSRHVSRIPGIVHTATDLTSADVTSIDGIPCTPVARTLADLGAAIPVRRLEHCTDGALRDEKTTSRSSRKSSAASADVGGRASSHWKRSSSRGDSPSRRASSNDSSSGRFAPPACPIPSPSTTFGAPTDGTRSSTSPTSI